eukprot:CCRYP_018256-RA/>CCRYP_018256-RA protein AED:0.38 eAED:0.38 QI:0/-1/0/1/-1/1/1/0/121
MMPKRHMTQKVIGRLFYANLPMTPSARLRTAESLSLKADMLALRTKMTDSALEVFQLYANLLTEEARQPWDLIVKEQTESSPFHDIFESKGRSHRARRPSHSGGASYSTSNRVSHMTQAKI